ncbi:hypothetical protein [Acinetobacter sp. ANC 4558]|uniref:hypothetical protein n=1 Tax=Acinetobacter sp. ANC 4558 TaxID=1977876 RepID=UPI001D1708DA|nr:hypothetical protein [Acinetobacter sp. ANC 4558]
MKMILIGVVCCFMSVGVFAKATPSKEKIEFCEINSNYAKSVMRNRQNGGNISDSLKIVEKNVKNQDIKGFYIAIIKDAYKQPIWGSGKNKIEAETEFGNELFLICLDNFEE